MFAKTAPFPKNKLKSCLTAALFSLIAGLPAQAGGETAPNAQEEGERTSKTQEEGGRAPKTQDELVQILKQIDAQLNEAEKQLEIAPEDDPVLSDVHRIPVDETSRQLAQILRTHEADIHAETLEKKTFLHLIVTENFQNKIALVHLFLENGADPNALDEEKRTPLMWLLGGPSSSQNCQILKLFLRYGLNLKQLYPETSGPKRRSMITRKDSVHTYLDHSIVKIIGRHGSNPEGLDWSLIELQILLRDWPKINLTDSDSRHSLELPSWMMTGLMHGVLRGTSKTSNQKVLIQVLDVLADSGHIEIANQMIDRLENSLTHRKTWSMHRKLSGIRPRGNYSYPREERLAPLWHYQDELSDALHLMRGEEPDFRDALCKDPDLLKTILASCGFSSHQDLKALFPESQEFQSHRSYDQDEDRDLVRLAYQEVQNLKPEEFELAKALAKKHHIREFIYQFIDQILDPRS